MCKNIDYKIKEFLGSNQQYCNRESVSNNNKNYEKKETKTEIDTFFIWW